MRPFSGIDDCFLKADNGIGSLNHGFIVWMLPSLSPDSLLMFA